MPLIPITDSDYDSIHTAVSQLVRDNVIDIDPLLNTIKQAFDITVPAITDKSWYANESEYSPKIIALIGVWTETNKNIEKTAEVLFKAWCTALIIMALHALCANKIQKYIKDAELNETWDTELSYSFEEKTFIRNILTYPGTALNVGRFSPRYTIDQVSVTLRAPYVFMDSTLADVLRGNIPVDLVFWRNETMYYSVDQVQLNSIGNIVKEQFLAREQAIIRRKCPQYKG